MSMKARSTAYFLLPAISLLSSSSNYVRSFSHTGNRGSGVGRCCGCLSQAPLIHNIDLRQNLSFRSQKYGRPIRFSSSSSRICQEDARIGPESAPITNWMQMGCKDQVGEDTDSNEPLWRYHIILQFPPYQHITTTTTNSSSVSETNGISSSDGCSTKLLSHALVNDWNAYPTVSQVRKACREEKVVILRENDINLCNNESSYSPNQLMDKALIENIPENLSDATTVVMIGTPNSILQQDDVVAILDRTPDEYYPSSDTGYIRPPALFCTTTTTNSHKDQQSPMQQQNLRNSLPQVIYQDDHIALVNKPENLTTIGDSRKRDDLQSILPFILTPPCLSTKRQNKNHNSDALKLPRAIHRLDRKTSGIVLVGKTNRAIKYWSNCFAKRQVKKTYVALVLGENGTAIDILTRRSSCDNSATTRREETNYSDDDRQINEPNDNSDQRESTLPRSCWNVIDYPIDGKPAKTEWRVLDVSKSSPSSSSLGDETEKKESRLYLLEVRPSSGRYHQIRRHLSYCLGCAIVGDAKYDGGSLLAKSLRTNGMFLCAAGIEYQYPSNLFEKQKGHDQLVSSFSSLQFCHTNEHVEVIRDEILKRSTAHWCVSPSRKDSGSRNMNAVIPLPRKFSDMLYAYSNTNND